MGVLELEDTTMKEAYEELQRLSADKETRKAAIAREIHLRDQVQREFDAREEGKTEVALNMYKKQYPIEAIADVTDMSVEDVLRIVKSSMK